MQLFKKLVFAKDATSIQRFLVARDLAFFCVDIYAGDQAPDLGMFFNVTPSCVKQPKFKKMTSVFHASALLLIMNIFIITFSK